MVVEKISFRIFFSNFQNRNCKKNNWESLTVCWHLFELSKIGHNFVKRARPWRTRIERGYFSSKRERTLCRTLVQHSSRSFREREIRSIFYVARNFPPRRFLSLCSQLKSQDLSWWFHASSVLRRDTILFARALNREDESFWPVYKIIFFRILYDWHWESVALKNCTRRDRLKIAGQSDQFGQWRFTENNSVDNGFKFLQFSHSRQSGS